MSRNTAGLRTCGPKEEDGVWHNPDMPTPLLNVRYRVRSGKHLLAASISAFDLEPTLRCNGSS